MTRATLMIPNMECPACNMHLEGIEDDLPGIKFIKGNYRKQQLEVEFDENKIQLDEIRAAVIEMGYDIAN